MKIEIGSLFRLKEGARENLTPAFNRVTEAFIKGAIEEQLANPEYFFKLTYLERGGPLEHFLRKVFEGLKRSGPTVLPLRIGFGFGKTHASIFLLHCFLSAERIPEFVKEMLRSFGWSEELAQRTLVFPLDFYAEQYPVASLRRTLKAYTAKGTGFWRGEKIKKLIEEREFDNIEETPSRFAKEIVNLAKACNASLLFIIDEIGWGSRTLIENYIHGKEKNHLALSQIIWLSSFLVNLAEESNREKVPLVLVYSFAEQDERVIENLAMIDENVRKYWEVAKLDLFDRLARYSGGVVKTALGLNPDDMIKIAMFRVLFPIGGEPDKDRISQRLAESASTLLGVNEKEVRELLRRYYPLSPLMIHALRKLARREDLPTTEYVRSAISLLAEAAERALSSDPYSPTIDVKHLELESACFSGNLGDAAADWLSLAAELKVAASSAEKELIRSCEHAAKVILSKGATSNTITLLRIENKRLAKMYGTTLEDLQLAAFLTSKPEEAEIAVHSIKRAVEYLLRASSSIEERVIEGTSFLFPAIAGTVLSRLRDYINEEKRKAGQDPLGYLRSSSFLHQVTSHLMSEKASVLFTDFHQVEDPEKLAVLIGKALSEPKPAVVFVNLHDEKLAQKIREKGWDAVVSSIVAKLNEEASIKAIGRPPYLIVAIPNLKDEHLKPLLESLAEYQGAENFLEYLNDEEKVIEDLVSRTEAIATVKRLKLPAGELRKIIKDKVGKEIEAARDIADRNKLKVAREAAKKLVDIYTEAIIRYDLNSRKFLPIDTSELISRAMEKVEVKDPKTCADVLNALLNNIVEAYFISSTERLEKPIKEFLRHRVEEGQVSEVKVDDLLESLFQGSFGAVPLNRTIAEDTVAKLSGTTFDLLDATVTVFVREGRIHFERRAKPTTIKREGELAPSAPGTKEETLGEFTLSDVPKETIIGLRDVLNSLGGDISSLVVSLKEEDGYGLGTLTIRKNFSDAIGPLAALARTLNAKGDFRVVLKAPKSRDEVARLLGPLGKYLRLGAAGHA